MRNTMAELNKFELQKLLSEPRLTLDTVLKTVIKCEEQRGIFTRIYRFKDDSCLWWDRLNSKIRVIDLEEFTRIKLARMEVQRKHSNIAPESV